MPVLRPDFAVVCMCNGDRTVKHIAMRNIVFGKTQAAGLTPIREKPGATALADFAIPFKDNGFLVAYVATTFIHKNVAAASKLFGL